MLTILADDLSGAADCGLQAARLGLRTIVTLSGTADHGAAVVARDLDTRDLPAPEAFARTRAAALSCAGGPNPYIKLDSSLRGNVGAAVDAVLEASGAAVALVAPAFPALGRTTGGGIHRIAGPGGTAVEKDLPALLRGQSRHEVAHVPLGLVRAGAPAPPPGRARILAGDAETEEDLAALVAMLASHPGGVVWAGSAGLLGAVLRGGDALPAAADASAGPPPAGPVLIFAGSAARETADQVSELLAQGEVTAIPASAAALAAGGAAAVAETVRVAALAGGELAAGRDCVVHLAGDVAPEPALQQAIARGLGTIAGRAVEAALPAGLVLTGGETARRVCEALGVDAIELIGEVQAGIPLGHATGTSLSIVTKAGAFGARGALLEARDAIHRRSTCPVR